MAEIRRFLENGASVGGGGRRGRRAHAPGTRCRQRAESLLLLVLRGREIKNGPLSIVRLRCRLSQAGAIGGCAFWTVALPFDYVKSRQQVGAVQTSTYGTLRDVFQNGRGFRQLYVGYGSALVRGVPGAAVVFAVYGAVHTKLAEPL